VRLFARTLLDDLAAKAAVSPRQRAHLNVHAGPADVVQRFFVAADRNSYFRPHRHLGKTELALVVRGAFEVLTFDESGRLMARYAVGSDCESMGFEMPRATWHTLLARIDGSIFLEVKEGPYDPATASEFAPWSPSEGEASVPLFMERLRSAVPGARA